MNRWTLLGQQIAMGLTEAVGTAAVVGTSVAAQSYAAAVNPVGTVAQLAGAAKGFQGQNQPTIILNGSQAGPPPAAPASAPVKDAAAAKDADKTKEKGLSKLRSMFAFKSGSAKAAVTSAAKGTLATDKSADSTSGKDSSVTKGTDKWPACDGKFYPTDPAFSAIEVIVTYVDGVRALIVNADDIVEIKWEDIIPPTATGDQPAERSKATTLRLQLERKIKTFKPDAKGLASQLATRILAEAYAVASELVEEGAKSKAIGDWRKPDADSPQVQDWEQRITRCSEAATTVKQSANSTPGVIPGGMPSLFPQKTDAEVQASANLKTNLAQETVKAATTKLTSAQDVYKSTLNTYKEMRTKNAELQIELAKARAEVEQLNLQTVTEVSDTRKTV